MKNKKLIEKIVENVDGILRLIEHGVLTINEVRKMLGLKEIKKN